MKTRIILGLCVVLGAGSIFVRAADNPAQAAARAALQYKLSQPDAWDPQPLTTITALTTPAGAARQSSVNPAANGTATLSAKAATSAMASTGPLAAAVPRVLLLVMLLLIVSFLTMSFLLLKLLRQNSRAYDSGEDSTGSRTWNV